LKHLQDSEDSIAIVLAVYNPNILFLRKQILSIRDQTNTNWVCYINDDASTREWHSEVKDLLDKRFIVKNSTENIGAYRNFEHIINDIRSEKYVFLCDQDDIWSSEKIDRMLAEFEENTMLVYSDATIIDEFDEVQFPSLHKYEHTETSFNSPLGLILKNSITGCTAAVKRDVLIAALPFPESGGIQHDLWIGLVASHLGKITYIPDQLISYRRHSSNVIGASAPNFFREFLNLRVAAISYLIKNQLLHTYQDRFESKPSLTLRSIIMSTTLSRRQKLYGINFKTGKFVVLVHDFPVKIKIFLHQIFHTTRNRKFSNRHRIMLLGVDKSKTLRSIRFALKIITSRQIRQKSLTSLKTVESFDFHLSSLKVKTMGRGVAEVKTLATQLSKTESNSIIFFIPSLDEAVLFGGIATAIKIACSLGEKMNVKFCITDQNQHEIPEKLIIQLINTLHVNPQSLRRILGKVEYGKVSFSKNDIFFTTAWWTTSMASNAAKTMGDLKIPIFYLVQDFEPLFYSASSQYVEALNTYKIADFLVVNSKSLADYISEVVGITLQPKLIFEPQFLQTNLPVRSIPVDRVGPIKIVIYGRPGVPRNLFLTLINSLDFALLKFPHSSYEIVSVGEKHDDVLLESGYLVRSLGKLHVEEYLKLISSTDLGVSLMMSPHPSYPPLEMASAGMQVVTNDFFKYKANLMKIFPNLYVEEPSVEMIGLKIAELLSGKSPSTRSPKKIVPLGNSIDEVVTEVLRLIRNINSVSNIK